MPEGRTSYWGKDSRWWGREYNVILGMEFGADGPAVIDFLSCEADLQRDSGRVRSGPASIASGCFVGDVDRVKAIVRRACELGSLEEYQERGAGFTCRISGWQKDQQRARNAERKREQRVRDAAGLSRPVTPGHAQSRPVPDLTADEADNPDETLEPSESPLRAVEATLDTPGEQESGSTVNAGSSRRRSRSVTPGHGESRPVTKSHPKTRPDLTTTAPPLPPRGGGRQRDYERELEHYNTSLRVFLDEHPCCSPDSDQFAEWRTAIDQLEDRDVFATVTLAGSHPHAGVIDGAALIGVHPEHLMQLVAKCTRSSRWLDQITNGRQVHFFACPTLERSAA